MTGIGGVCSRLAAEIVQALGVARSSPNSIDQTTTSYNRKPPAAAAADQQEVDDLMMMRALTAIFGMENNGKFIKKKKALQVVEKLGLIYEYGQEAGEDDDDQDVDQDLDKSSSSSSSSGSNDEVAVEELLSGLEQVSERQQLLHEAFKIFDKDGNGYIEAVEVKRVLQCLGLDKGWDITDIQKMLKVVDLNLDGKVDFTEFELMMSYY